MVLLLLLRLDIRVDLGRDPSGRRIRMFVAGALEASILATQVSMKVWKYTGSNVLEASGFS